MMFQEVTNPLGITKGPSTLLKVNENKVLAIVDTMASVSFVTEKMVKQLFLEKVKLIRPMEVIMANQTNGLVKERTEPGKIETHDGRTFEFAFNVFPTEHGMVLGQDVLPKLGIYAGNFNALHGIQTTKLIPINAVGLLEVLQEFEAFTINYIDDIIVFSNSLEEHVEHARKVLARLNDFNLRVNFEKLDLRVEKLLF
jgi:uncharacterized protein (DUF2235 family)